MGVGAIGVGETGVGVSVACGLHPNSSNRVNPIPQIFCIRFFRFIKISSVLQLLADGKRANGRRQPRPHAGIGCTPGLGVYVALKWNRE